MLKLKTFALYLQMMMTWQRISSFCGNTNVVLLSIETHPCTADWCILIYLNDWYWFNATVYMLQYKIISISCGTWGNVENKNPVLSKVCEHNHTAFLNPAILCKLGKIFNHGKMPIRCDEFFDSLNSMDLLLRIQNGSDLKAIPKNK